MLTANTLPCGSRTCRLEFNVYDAAPTVMEVCPPSSSAMPLVKSGNSSVRDASTATVLSANVDAYVHRLPCLSRFTNFSRTGYIWRQPGIRYPVSAVRTPSMIAYAPGLGPDGSPPTAH